MPRNNQTHDSATNAQTPPTDVSGVEAPNASIAEISKLIEPESLQSALIYFFKQFRQSVFAEYHGTGAEPYRERGFSTNCWFDTESARLLAALDQMPASSYETALADIVAWSEAYPKTVFLPPDYAKAHEALQAVGMTLDAISADIMRTAMDEVGKRARAALKPPAHKLPARDEDAEELFQSERISEALATYDYILGDLEPGDPDWEESAFNAMKAAIQRADHIARTSQTGER